MAWGSFLQGEKGEEAPKTHLVWRERWRAQNCRGNPETQKKCRKSRNWWKAVKVSWCCPTWLDIQSTAAARLWLRCSWKGTQGWSIPEGELVLMWRQRHLTPLGPALVIAFSKTTAPELLNPHHGEHQESKLIPALGLSRSPGK